MPADISTRHMGTWGDKWDRAARAGLLRGAASGQHVPTYLLNRILTSAVRRLPPKDGARLVSLLGAIDGSGCEVDWLRRTMWEDACEEAMKVAGELGNDDCILALAPFVKSYPFNAMLGAAAAGRTPTLCTLHRLYGLDPAVAWMDEAVSAAAASRCLDALEWVLATYWRAAADHRQLAALQEGLESAARFGCVPVFDRMRSIRADYTERDHYVCTLAAAESGNYEMFLRARAGGPPALAPTHVARILQTAASNGHLTFALRYTSDLTEAERAGVSMSTVHNTTVVAALHGHIDFANAAPFGLPAVWGDNPEDALYMDHLLVNAVYTAADQGDIRAVRWCLAHWEGCDRVVEHCGIIRVFGWQLAAARMIFARRPSVRARALCGQSPGYRDLSSALRRWWLCTAE